VTSGGNNLNDFPENQLTKFRAVYTVKVNRGQKVCRQSFMQDSLRKKSKITNPWGFVDPQLSPPKWRNWVRLWLTQARVDKIYITITRTVLVD